LPFELLNWYDFETGRARSWDRKTVMAPQSHRTHGLDPDEAGSTIEERRALDDLFSLLYEELRRLASLVRRNEVNATLNSTALVNEAWMKLAHSPHLAALPPLHFKRIAARAMRQLLIEAARQRGAHKRGGGDMRVTLSDANEVVISSDKELLALDEALKELARVNSRQARVIECRFFGGLDVKETAELLNVSEATILRDWKVARAWLENEIHPGQ
jgi:RNA polymerase sigma factor (TIGR02999 family)